MTVAEVAERPGYAEAASFSHAFKRWKGSSPSVYGPAPEEARVAAPDSSPPFHVDRPAPSDPGRPLGWRLLPSA